MQKILLTFLLLAIPAFSSANFLGGGGDGDPASLIGFLAPLSPEEKEVALILKTTGQVQVNRSPNNAWQNAMRGARLDAGSQIRTGEESLAAIVFTDDKSLLKVRSNSKIMIAGKREQAASGSRRLAKTISMEFGELWAKVTKGASPFRVETPSGVAAVKGTVFYAILEANGNFVVICLDGIIELINQLGSVLVNAGETGISSSNQPPESRPTQSGEIPNWANDGDRSGEMEIEFQDENGQKKKLKIRYQ